MISYAGEVPTSLLLHTATVHEFTTEREMIDHAACERAGPLDPEREAEYAEAVKRAAALDFVFFLEDADAMRWAAISRDVARYNRG